MLEPWVDRLWFGGRDLQAGTYLWLPSQTRARSHGYAAVGPCPNRTDCPRLSDDFVVDPWEIWLRRSLTVCVSRVVVSES